MLIVKHDLPLERIFRQDRTLKPADIKPGEKFRVTMTPLRLGWVTWWAFGDVEGDLKGKKFARWQLPDEKEGWTDLNVSEKEPDIDRLQAEGWVFSERLDKLKISGNSDDAVFEFVE